MSQMPVEGKKFRTVDRVWRDIMKGLEDNPLALAVTSNETLLPHLKESHALLEEIQMGLNEYLERKRYMHVMVIDFCSGNIHTRSTVQSVFSFRASSSSPTTSSWKSSPKPRIRREYNRT